MTTLLPKLNSDLGEWADRVRQSLVHMSVGRKGSGSGVVFASDGLVVTNAHVLSGGRGHSSQTCEFQVTMPRGTVVKSVLLGKDDDIPRIRHISVEKATRLIREKIEGRLEGGPAGLRRAFQYFDADGSGSLDATVEPNAT